MGGYTGMGFTEVEVVLVPVGYVPGNPNMIWISIALNSKDMDYSLVYIDIYTSFSVHFTAAAVCARKKSYR
jgi:hypothetical protein